MGSTLLVESDGLPKPFISDLLFTELLLALQDRKDCYMAAREATTTVITRLLRLPEKPLFGPSQISQVAGAVLKKLDKRAYLRYSAEHPSLQS